MSIRDIIAEINPDALLVDGFDPAIIGTSECMRVVYSIEKMIEILVEEGMTEEDAWDHLSYNVLCAYVGEFTPIYVHTP